MKMNYCGFENDGSPTKKINSSILIAVLLIVSHKKSLNLSN